MTEFWPYGLARSGSDALDYLQCLTGLGFTLYELPKKGREIIPIVNLHALISRTQGRNYVNLLGLKGKVVKR
jgi:hypothetical protein